VLTHWDPEGVERFWRRVVGSVVPGEARQRPCGGQRFFCNFRRAVRAAPAHEAGLVFPQVMRAGENSAVLYPDDLLVDEGDGLLPSRLQPRLATGSMPAVPGGILGDRLAYRWGDEPVVEFGPLVTVVPGRAIGRGRILVA